MMHDAPKICCGNTTIHDQESSHHFTYFIHKRRNQAVYNYVYTCTCTTTHTHTHKHTHLSLQNNNTFKYKKTRCSIPSHTSQEIGRNAYPWVQEMQAKQYCTPQLLLNSLCFNHNSLIGRLMGQGASADAGSFLPRGGMLRAQLQDKQFSQAKHF